MNGILVIDKDQNMTSFDVINKIKKSLKIKKIGHAGTLDPLATGVLVVLLNEATKLSNYLLNDEKEYLCEIVVGHSTTTEDIEGEILEKKDVEKLENVDEVLNSLVGDLLQVPPMYSAVHYQGKKLYELARKGEVVEREARNVKIYAINRVSDIVYENNIASFSFQTTVSKGTYLRTLCVEIGKRLGYPAHMKALRRLRSGALTIASAYSLHDVLDGKFQLISMLEALNKYHIIEVDKATAGDILNGKKIKINANDDLIVLSYQNNLLAIYERDNDYYRAKRIWN
ncbi:MAG TPA: tRNA pseudouridine(55) synthase TruB [Bacilli bacterium]